MDTTQQIERQRESWRDGDGNANEKCQKHRRAEVVREMIGKRMSHMFFCSFISFCVSIPSRGDHWPSFFLSPVNLLSSSPLLLSLLLLPPFALCRPGYSIKEESGSWWIEAFLSSKHTPAFTIFSSLTSFFPSLFTCRREHFSFFSAVVTHRIAGVEDMEEWRERLREKPKMIK